MGPYLGCRDLSMGLGCSTLDSSSSDFYKFAVWIIIVIQEKNTLGNHGYGTTELNSQPSQPQQERAFRNVRCFPRR